MPISDILPDLLYTDLPFAFIKFPGDDNLYWIIKDSEGQNLYSFTSFTSSKEYTFSFSQLNKISGSDCEELSMPLSKRENTTVASKEDYLELVKKAIHFLQEKKAQKIVISREKWIDNENMNPIQSFLFLCKQYPNSFCHLSYWNSKEIWLGATPEILGHWNNSTFKTVALAGTLPDKDSFLWENKEIEEQAYVTQYILEKLNNYSNQISITGPDTLHLGHIKHLITYFSVQLGNPALLSDLIKCLHPTPAVCGLPLEVSRNFILNEEGYNRDFYAGYIGIETLNSKNYFVNLRCAKLYNNGALLFVGGGITAQSDPFKEWNETELKTKFIAESL